MRAKGDIYQVGHGRVAEQQRRGLLDILKSHSIERQISRTRHHFAPVPPRVPRKPPSLPHVTQDNAPRELPKRTSRATSLSHEYPKSALTRPLTLYPASIIRLPRETLGLLRLRARGKQEKSVEAE